MCQKFLRITVVLEPPKCTVEFPEKIAHMTNVSLKPFFSGDFGSLIMQIWVNCALVYSKSPPLNSLSDPSVLRSDDPKRFFWSSLAVLGG